MLCREIMRRDYESVGESSTVLEAARRMRDLKVGILPVHDENQRVVGVLTTRDIAIRVCAEAGLPAGIYVRDVMTFQVLVCRAEDELSRAEELMKAHHKSRILITDGQGRLSGIISLSDIVELNSEGAVRRSSDEAKEVLLLA